MITEQRVRELAIRWYFLALLTKHNTPGKAPTVFAKAHAFILVLGLPSDISCGKKSEDGLKQYAQQLLGYWLKAFESDSTLSVQQWLNDNVKLDFEQQI